MPKKSSRRQKVSFTATRRVSVPKKVSFRTKKGKRVSFTAHKRASKRVCITFYARPRPRK